MKSRAIVLNGVLIIFLVSMGCNGGFQLCRSWFGALAGCTSFT